jgi:hypothetical protein
MLSHLLRLVLCDTDTDADGNSDEDDEHRDTQADPLVPAGAAGVLDALVDLFRALANVDVSLLSLVFRVPYNSFLLYDHGVKILEEQCKLVHLLLDL